jgi:hypothetical protein
MSLTSYQTAPPRDLERPIITAFATNATANSRSNGADKILAASIFRGKVYACSTKEKIPAN